MPTTFTSVHLLKINHFAIVIFRPKLSTINILTKQEIFDFNSPPILTSREREKAFRVTRNIKEPFSSIRTPINKTGFLLQLAYVRISGKFFKPQQFNSKDVTFLSQNLFNQEISLDLSRYSPRTHLYHQKIIAGATGLKLFNGDVTQQIEFEIKKMAEVQTRPRLLFEWIVSFMRKKRIEIPTYYPLATLISSALNKNEAMLLKIIEDNIEPSVRSVLDHLVDTYDDVSRSKSTSPIKLLKKLNQSPGAKKINKGIEEFEKLKNINGQIKGIQDCLNMPSELIGHYADYTIRSTKFQLNQLKPNKRYLYMIAFIANQLNRMQDSLIDHFIQAVQSANHSALVLFRENHFACRKDHGRNIYPLFHSLEKDVFAFISGLEETLDADHLDNERKILQMKEMFADYKMTQPVLEEQMSEIRDDLFKASKEIGFYDALEAKSRSLQRKVTKIVCSMEVDSDSENKKLILAINYLRYKPGKVTETYPMGFLSTEERDLLFNDEGKFRISLYKIMMFRHIMASIKSGTLNMKHSFKYRSLEEYMLPREEWQTNQKEMLERASMTHLLDFDAVMNKVKDILHKQYESTNAHILDGKNEYVKFNKDQEIIVTTPKVFREEDNAPDLFCNL